MLLTCPRAMQLRGVRVWGLLMRLHMLQELLLWSMVDLSDNCLFGYVVADGSHFPGNDEIQLVGELAAMRGSGVILKKT